MFAGINSSLTVNKLPHAGCLAAAVLGGSVRNQQVVFTPNRFWVGGSGAGLAAELDKAINDVFTLLDTAFATPIRQALDGAVGGPLRNLTDSALQSLLHEFTQNATCAHNASLPPPEKPPAGAVDWGKSGVIEAVDFLVGGVVGAHGPFGVDGLVDLLTGGSGALALNGSSLPAIPTVHLPVLGNVSVSVLSLSVAGLDSVEEVSLLEPVAGDVAALRSRLALGTLNASVSVEMRSSALTSPVKLGLSVSLRGLSLGAQGRLAVNSSALSDIDSGQLLSPACWLRMVLEGSLQSIDAGIAGIGLSVRGNDWGASSQEVTARLGAPLHVQLPKMASDALAAVVNPLIASEIAKLQHGNCPDVPPPSPPLPPSRFAYDWGNCSALAQIDHVINDVIGGNLDMLVDALTKGTGAISLPASKLPPISLPGNITLTFQTLSVAGLDSVEEVSLLEPVAGDVAALRSRLALGTLNVSVSVEMRSSALTSPVKLGLSVSLRGLSLGAQGRLAINTSVVEDLQLLQVLNGSGCLPRMVLEGSLQSIDAGIAGIGLAVRGNDWGASSQEVTARLGAPLHVQLPKMASDALAAVVNPLIASKIAKLQEGYCPPHSNASRHTSLPLAEMNTVAALRSRINSLGWQGFDHAVDAYDRNRHAALGHLALPFNVSLPTIRDAKIGDINVRLFNVALDGVVR